jgi:putative ABC transport system permease protein
MTLIGIGLRNLQRNRTRVLLTILGGAVAVLAFVLLRTVVTSWGLSADNAAKDRLGIRQKVSIVMPLPKHYVDVVREVPGVTQATHMTWFGGKDPRNPETFFANMAVDPASALQVLDEIVVDPAARTRWLEDRQGALVGDLLARKLNLKVGDRVTLTGTIFPGNWEFNIDAIYTTSRKSFDRSNFLFHWDYLNASIPTDRQDQIGWMIARVDSPERVPEVCAKIDRIFEERDVQTTTMSERAMNLSFMASISAVLDAMNIVALIIAGIMAMILGNTIAMGVRERTREYGVLRALGFSRWHVVFFVVGEGLVVGLLAGAVGLVLSYPVVQLALGRWLQENVGSMFAYFSIQPATIVLALVLSLCLGAGAAVFPALRTYRLSVVDALRRVQ